MQKTVTELDVAIAHLAAAIDDLAEQRNALKRERVNLTCGIAIGETVEIEGENYIRVSHRGDMDNWPYLVKVGKKRVQAAYRWTSWRNGDWPRPW